MTHNVVRLLGEAPDGEVWSCGFRVAGYTGGPAAGTADTAQMQVAADAIAGLNSGLVIPSGMLATLSTALAITAVRIEAIGAGGALTSAVESVKATPVVGTGTPQRPLQTAWCVTLNLGAVFGRSGRGRVFWPAVSGTPAVDATVRVLSAARTTFMTGFTTFVAGITSEMAAATSSTPWHLVVYSRKLDGITKVTNISLGDVLDTQRRRRDSLKEARTTIAL